MRRYPHVAGHRAAPISNHFRDGTSGTASTSLFFANGLSNCTSNNVLTWTGGTFGCEPDDTSAGGANPFTWEDNYATINAATTSILWAKLGLNASSTSHFATAVFDIASSTNASTTFLTAGTQWFTSLANSGLGVDPNGKVYAAATSTLPTISGTLALTQLANQNANTVLANGTAGSAAPTAIATSSLFAALDGQILGRVNGTWTGVATTTFSTGLTYANGVVVCDTASHTILGCLSTADWDTFSAKQNALAFTYPLQNNTNTISLAFGTTTQNFWSAYNNFPSLFALNASTTNATTTNLHILGLANSGLGVDANGKVYAAATSTLANISGTLALTQLANQNANTVMANSTGASAAPTAISTTSLFAALNGQILGRVNGTWTGIATTTFSNGLTYANGVVTCDTASGSVLGCLSSADWTTFNNKQAAGNYITALTGDVTASGPGSASVSFALGNTHWWTARQNFGNASTSQFTATSSVWFTSLGTPAGTFLAVDPNGLVIATSTPAVGGSGTVTNIATTYPITGGPITTTGTLSLAFGTTTTNTWAHQIFSSLFALSASTTNATTTNLHITGLTNSGLGVDANGKVYAAATSTLANISGTLALTQLANQNANTVLANATGGSAAPTAIATSSVFGTGIGGTVLSWSGGVPSWVATTTLTNGTGITTSYSATNNQWTVTNTGALFGYPFTTGSTFATSTAATTTSISTQGVFFASSTAAASQFPFASTTAITSTNASTTNLTVSSLNAASCDVKASAAGVLSCGTDADTNTAFAWTPSTYGTQAVNATSTGLWLKGANLSLIASSSFTTYASTTAFTNSGSTWLTSLTSSGLGVDANGKVYAAATSTLANISGSLNLGTQVTGSLALSSIATQAANTVLANLTGGNAAPTAIGTTTLFTGTGGQVLTFANGAWTGVGTTTLTNGAGITTTYSTANNQWTITNTGALFAYPWTVSSTYATSTSATTTSIQTQGVFFASSTAAASQFPFASSTALSAGTLCLSTDCRTSWPSGSSAFSFTPLTNFNLAVNATSTPLWLKAGLMASTTSYFNGIGMTTGSYLNFGSATGTSGYGFRDNAGVMEFKNSGGTWAGVNTATSGPSFSARNNANQSITAVTWTELTLNTEDFDTNNNFASSKFTPTVPGKYLITGNVYCLSASSCAAAIWKNGSDITASDSYVTGAGSPIIVRTAAIVDMNGTTDYVRLAAYSSGTSIDSNFTNMQGALLAPVNATAGGWQNDGTQSFLADSTDKVGIGTSTPWAMLSINPTALLGTAPQFLIGSGTATTLIATNAGRVGIGTSSPYALFSIFAASSTPGGGTPTFNPFLFVIGSSSASATSTLFNVTNTGFTGIGTTSPWGLLSVNANAIGTAPQFVVGSSTATNFLVTNAGKVGIGTTSPAYALDVNGDVNVASGNCFRVNGVCIGYTVKLAAIFATSTPGTNASVVFTGAQGSAPSFSTGTLTLPSNTSHIVTEVWGAGGGGAGTGDSNSGNASCFGTNTTACTTPLLSATGGGSAFGNSGSTGGAGGTGGTGSGGDINLTGLAGGNGITGVAGTTNGRGGVGGNAPRGGGGTGAGSPFGGGGGGGTGSGGAGGGGGGGGGGYSQKLIINPSGTFYYTVGVGGTAGTGGGAGGAGGIVITVYATSSPTAAGNDYAEMFPVSNPGINAGDIVAVDAGIPVSMKLATAGENAPLAGVISTNPGQTLGDINATGQRPVALSGRVPAKVNLEGGPIAIGDRIALSWVPGVGKKAGPFDESVGVALETFSGADGSSQGSVTVFLDLQRGINIDEIGMTLLGTSATTTAGTPFDFVGNLLSAITSRITIFAGSTTAATSTSATSTTVSSTPESQSFAESFFGNIFSRLVQWFADAANGIGDLFAKVGHFDKVQTDDLCVGTTCVNEQQLAALLGNVSQSPSTPPPPETAASSSDPATTPTPESNTSPAPSDAATTSPAVYTEPVERVIESIPPIIDSPPLAPEEEPEPTLTPTAAPISQ